MDLIGWALILVIIGSLIWYFKWSKKEESATKTSEGQHISVVIKGAYSPNIVRAKAGEKLTIEFDRQEDSECSKKIIIKDFNISQELPDFGKTAITVNPQKAGEHSFTCEMGMYQGKIIVE